MEGARGIVIFGLAGVFAASMVAAAVIDARSRRFPNILAAFMTLVAVALMRSLYPAQTFFAHVLCGIAVLLSLMLFELIWRRVVGRAGLGMGDAKALAILALMSPMAALISFCISMVLLAVICLARRVKSMPLLPLLLPTFIVVLAVWPSVWSRLDGGLWI